VTTALLLRHYRELPERGDDEPAGAWHQRHPIALERFQQQVTERYTEGTLQRLLDATEAQTRQAAVLALGFCGTMSSNKPLAGMLSDEDPAVRHLAAESLWEIWFRAGTPEQNAELRRLVELAAGDDSDAETVLAGYDALIRQAPLFAEVWNQRAIVWFTLGEYGKAAKDCERVLKLNPQHFGAAGGLAQCYLKQRKLRAALRAYRRSFRINPNLDGVQQAIQSLERTLGEEGKR
jgi:tetratricopeptide (TPR) repeat protein